MKRMCLGETVPAVEVMSTVCLMHLPQPDSQLQNPAFSPTGGGAVCPKEGRVGKSAGALGKKEGWLDRGMLAAFLAGCQPATRDGNFNLKGSSSAARLCSGLFD